MMALAVGLIWSASGVVGALTDHHERSVAWVIAGALLGPPWPAGRADRPEADRLQPIRLEVRHSRLRPRSPLTA